mmetsp:Transcript_58821/g.70160  ORF Transcript_58821/g.70160 Transcript_58821/m.70160 type:complete len:133 (-) Transcript_58821:146-544(-)
MVHEINNKMLRKRVMFRDTAFEPNFRTRHDNTEYSQPSMYLRDAMQSMRNLASRFSFKTQETESEKAITGQELAILMKTDDELWNKFQDQLRESQVITDYGVIEELRKFIDENDDDIRYRMVERNNSDGINR